jgi:hypothetical protein
MLFPLMMLIGVVRALHPLLFDADCQKTGRLRTTAMGWGIKKPT